MMRILLVIESASAGSGKNTLDLAQGLIAAGHAVDLVYSPRREDAMFRARREQIFGDRAVAIDMKTVPGPWDIAAYRQLRKFVADRAPYDVIHGQSSKAGALVRLLPSKFGAKVYTPHAFKAMDPNCNPILRGLFNAVEWGLGQWQTHGLICVSPAERDVAQKLGIGAAKTHLVVNGVSRSGAALPRKTRADLGIASRSTVVGFVGRFCEQKAPERFIRAIAAAGPDADVHGLMIGGGEGFDRIKTMIGDLGLTGKITLTGYADASLYLDVFDLLVMPSRYESMPYILLEASEIGLPIVSTAVSGADVVISPNENGLIVPNDDDPKQLAAAIKEMTAPANLARFKTSARDMMNRFSLDEMIAKTVRVYSQAIAA